MAEIGKLTAAERLIVGGIAMSERGDDPLAIHVVAASALNMLRELIEQSGDNYAARTLREGLFHIATSRRNGQESTLPTSPGIDALINDIVAAMEAGDVNQPSDLVVNLGAEELRGMLNYIIRPYNFLKHAQRDPLATLDEEDVDPDGAIIHALTAMYALDPGRQLPEPVLPFLEKHGLV